MHTSWTVVPFGPDDPPPVAALAELHRQLIPDSPVVLLGRPFMERFYYRILPRDGLIFGAVAFVDGQPAGFVVGTHDADGFMRTALRRHWPLIALLAGSSLALEPARIASIVEAHRLMRVRRRALRPTAEGQILSFGVLPAYRSVRFTSATGARIAHELLVCAVDRFRECGPDLIRADVAVANTAARLFYASLGWSVRRTDGLGWRTPCVEYVLDLDQLAEEPGTV